MRLSKLTLTNFRGIKDFTFSPNGEDAALYGTNAAGKTTITDSVSYLLFDKGSDGKSLNPKTINTETGEEIHNLEHGVEASFLLSDSNTLTLKKIFKEKWQKKRGDLNPTFTGHDTNYWVDSVPVKKNEYIDRVKFLATPELFQLLSDVSFFSAKMHWQKRRELLLQVCGDITDLEVINAEKELSALTGILGKHTVDDYRKIIASQRSTINAELQKIPVRIDEATRGKVDTSASNREAIAKFLEDINKELAAAQDVLGKTKDNSIVTDLKRQKAELEAELSKLQIAADNEAHGEDVKVRKEIAALAESKEQLSAVRSRTTRTLEINGEQIESLHAKKESLLKEWHITNDREMDDNDLACPTCNREYVQENIAKIRSSFNSRKAEELDAIDNAGIGVSNKISTLEKERHEITEGIAALTEDFNKVVDKIDAKALTLGNGKTTPKTAKAITETQAKIAKLEESIQAVATDNSGEIEEKQAIVNGIKSEIKQAEGLIVAFDHNAKTDERIKQLAGEQKTLAADFEKLEGELYLTEKFTRAKVHMLEERINSSFSLARFKMFEEQINGGLKDCCTVTFGGVSYDAGLNNAARINVGIDIINTLSRHFGVNIPIIVDNAESVVDIQPSDSQIIRLVVSKEDLVLRAE